MNHLQHGASAATLFLQGENPDEFLALLQDAFQEHKPASQQSAGIVTRTVRDQWILLRRERAIDTFEVDLFARVPNCSDWAATDLHKMDLLDRYRTTAARAYTRSLKDLHNIKKLKHNEDRWQQLFELQKQKFSLERERFNLDKEAAERKAAAAAARQAGSPFSHDDDLDDDFDDDLEEILAEAEKREAAASAAEPTNAPPRARHDAVAQEIYIGLEHENTVLYDVTPSNNELRARLKEGNQVVRTYHFVGGVPAEYEHLITPDAVRWGKSTMVTKTLDFYEWQDLADLEPR